MLSNAVGLRRLAKVPSLAMVAFGAVSVSPGVVDAAPEIEIKIIATSTPTTWLEDRTFNITVANPGTEPLAEVEINGGDNVLVNTDFGDVIDGPTFVLGNSDAVLDPGEVWSFSTTAPTVPGWEYVVTATASADDTITATASAETVAYPDALPFPTAIEVVPDSDVVAPGTNLGFTISATNTSSVELDLDGEHRLLPPVRDGVVRNAPLGEPTVAGNGDSVLDPAETWVWRIAHVAVESDSYVELQLSIARTGFVPSYGIFFDGPPVAVEESIDTTTTAPETTAPPTTTPTTTAPAPSGQLPETGSTSTPTAWFAALLTIAGGLLVLVSRRRLTARR